MTVQYQIDGSIRRITTRAFGEVTIEEVFEHFDELSADPSFKPNWMCCSIWSIARRCRVLTMFDALPPA